MSVATVPETRNTSADHNITIVRFRPDNRHFVRARVDIEYRRRGVNPPWQLAELVAYDVAKGERNRQRSTQLAAGSLAVEWSVDQTGDYDESIESLLGYVIARQENGIVTLERAAALRGTGNPGLVEALAREALGAFDGNLPVAGLDLVAEEAARTDDTSLLATHIQTDQQLTVAQARTLFEAAHPQIASYPTADLTGMYKSLDI